MCIYIHICIVFHLTLVIRLCGGGTHTFHTSTESPRGFESFLPSGLKENNIWADSLHFLHTGIPSSSIHAHTLQGLQSLSPSCCTTSPSLACELCDFIDFSTYFSISSINNSSRCRFLCIPHEVHFIDFSTYSSISSINNTSQCRFLCVPHEVHFDCASAAMFPVDQGPPVARRHVNFSFPHRSLIKSRWRLPWVIFASVQIKPHRRPPWC